MAKYRIVENCKEDARPYWIIEEKTWYWPWWWPRFYGDYFAFYTLEDAKYALKDLRGELGDKEELVVLPF